MRIWRPAPWPNPPVGYAPLRDLDRAEGGWRIPVYIGKAVRENAKKGFTARPVMENKLFNRIRAHAKSIMAAENLNARDFRCRYLVLNDAYIGLAESVLIAAFPSGLERHGPRQQCHGWDKNGGQGLRLGLASSGA